VCWILLRVASRVARHIGLVDHPRGRKQHSQPTPLVGGIAMSIGFLVAVLLLDYGLTPYRFLFAGITVVIVIGVLDDMHELAPESRLWAQVFAALLMVGGGSVVLEDLGFLLSSDGLLLTGMLAWPITVFASVGVINALNMSDGLDGLAAAITLVVLACLAAFAWAAGDYRILGLVAILAAVVAPFLALNLRPDRPALVFMGDAGSMFLGFVLAWLLVQASQGEQRIMAPVTALWLFALPLLDTVSTLIRRLLLGRSPFLGDREHIHHLLLAAGLTEKQTLTVLVAFASVAAGCGLAGHFLAIPEPWMFSAFLALFGLYLWGTMRAWGRGRLLGRKLPVCSQPVAPQTVATQRE
jgi:UDP-GlcNAc:undecaprenyl-phosphate GlcNAc-1-phosphate transferase